MVLYYRGATINTMVLAGFIVGLGDIVDDAIIDVENIVRRLREHRKAGSTVSTARIILDASLEVRGAIVHSTLIVILAVSPVFFLGGLSGSFFGPLASSYIIAMIASTVVALVVTPALSLLLLKGAAIESKESPLVPWLKRHYGVVLTSVIKVPRMVYASTLFIVIVGVVTYQFLGETLLPEFKERDFLMHWVPPEGTSHKETFRITQQASRELRAIPGVRNFGAHIGRAVGGDEPYGINFTENWISIDPDVDYEKTRGAVEEVVAGYPGLRRDVQTYLKERIREVLTGSGDAIIVRVYGPDILVLREKAKDVEAALDGIPGLIDLHIGQQVSVPQIQVRLDMEKAKTHGLKPGDLRPTVAAFMSGIEVTDIHREGKVYDVFVWAGEQVRGNADQLREFLIDTPYGGRVRLGEIADIQIVPTPNKIQRENNSRFIDIDANVQGRDLGSVVGDVRERLEKVSFPVGYYPSLQGEYKERSAAQKNLLLASIIAAIVIFMVLYMTFQNGTLAIIIYLALPTALVGAVVATFLGDKVISLGTLVGTITILGLSARNSVMLIEHYRHLELEEGESLGLGLVLRGAGERLSPILMTTLSTVLALLPLIVRGSIQGYEVDHPMAVAIMGGVVTSTLLSLFVVPVLYYQFWCMAGKKEA
jgi:Cu/Ag efflux pump CusA